MKSWAIVSIVACLCGVSIISIMANGERSTQVRVSNGVETLPPFFLPMEVSSAELAAFPRDPIPRTFPPSWLDFATAASINKLEGEFRYRLVVDPLGEVSECTITKPSGSPLVDQRICSSLMFNARFYPALDEHQEPVRGVFEGEESYKLSGMTTYVGILASVDSQGRLTSCRWATDTHQPTDALDECSERLEVWKAFARENGVDLPAASDIPISFPPQLMLAGRAETP